MDAALEVQLLKVRLLPLLWKVDGSFRYHLCSVSCQVVFCYFVILVQEDSY